MYDSFDNANEMSHSQYAGDIDEGQNAFEEIFLISALLLMLEC